MSYELRPSGGLASALIEFALLLALISLFLMVLAVVFVVRCFVKYHKAHTSLWIALAVCMALCIVSALVYKITQFAGSSALAGIGIVGLLITCLVVDLKNRDTLQPEKTSLVERVLHTSWWANEDTPLETEREQLAA